jgi:hypothetical protein
MKQKTDKKHLSLFLKCVCEKNYADANKYLKEVADKKMKQRIKQLLN